MGTLFYRGHCARDSVGDSKWRECLELENCIAGIILAGNEWGVRAKVVGHSGGILLVLRCEQLNLRGEQLNRC